MVRPTTDKTAEVSMRFTYDGQQVENVYHVIQADEWNATTLMSLAEDFDTWWHTNLQPSLPNDLVLREVVATDLSSATGPSVTFPATSPQAGAQNVESLPNNVTLAIKWLTSSRGRSFRGRTFHLGLSDTVVLRNTATDALIAQLQTAYEALLTSITAGDGAALCVLSEVSGGAPRANGICTEITGVSIDPTIDSQRRRLPGRGR